MASRQVLLGLAALAVLAGGCDLGTYSASGSGDGGVAVDARILVDGAPPYHPSGFVAPTMHGSELKMQVQDCRGCHGQDLEGSMIAPSCDGCHTPVMTPTAWRTTCTFCHGGGSDMTGAPPRNLDGTTTNATGTFPAHGRHVTAGIAPAADCKQCHVKATDALSPGHIFDTTKGVAEVDFGTGLSRQGAFTMAGGCTTNYCHGNGRGDNGTVAMNAPAMTCSSCHAGMASPTTEWDKMSGLHSLHLGATVATACSTCHNKVTTSGTAIAPAGVALHINGLRNVDLVADRTGETALTWNAAAQNCTGSCHGHAHTSSLWAGGAGGGRYHPVGFSAATVHGAEAELGRQDCRSCHGATLTGGTYAGAATPSCDSCHGTPTTRTAWRTTCTYCHGGGVNQTGAPPRDLGARPQTVSQSFTAHPRHVTLSSAPAFDCVQCHKKPPDALTAGHMFDATPAKAEVSFTGGLSAVATFDGVNRCTNLYCHGNGRGDNGTIDDGAAPRTCGGCHASKASGSAAWALMSGDHRRHLGENNINCQDCHGLTTTTGTTVTNPALHINKLREIKFSAAGFTYDPATRRCTGTCHGDNHNETW